MVGCWTQSLFEITFNFRIFNIINYSDVLESELFREYNEYLVHDRWCNKSFAFLCTYRQNVNICAGLKLYLIYVLNFRDKIHYSRKSVRYAKKIKNAQ